MHNLQQETALFVAANAQSFDELVEEEADIRRQFNLSVLRWEFTGLQFHRILHSLPMYYATVYDGMGQRILGAPFVPNADVPRAVLREETRIVG